MHGVDFLWRVSGDGDVDGAGRGVWIPGGEDERVGARVDGGVSEGVDEGEGFGSDVKVDVGGPFGRHVYPVEVDEF